MKKYPFIKQEGLKDCGVASLLMIIKYYNGYISIEELRDITKTNKEGTTAYNIIDAAKKIGFDAKGVRCNLDEIKKDNTILPCIASVIINKSYLHFLVIYKIDFKHNYLIIGDPASSLKKVSFDYFKLIFNNILIMLYPVSPIPINSSPNIYEFIYNLVIKHKKLLIQLIILSVFITIFSILGSYYFQYMIDSVNFFSKKNVFFTFYIFFSIYLIKNISDYFRNRILIYINQKMDLELMIETFSKIINLPYHYLKNRTTGEILSRINDLNVVRDVISKVILSIFIDFPLTLLILVISFIMNKYLCLISIFLLFLYLIIIKFTKNRYNTAIRSIQSSKSNITSYMVESISGFETLKGIHIENDVNNKFENKYVNFLGEVFNYQKLYFNIKFIKDLINDIGFLIIILLGSIYIINGDMSIGTLITFNALLTYFLEPIKSILELNSNIKEAKSALKRVLDILIDKDDKGFIGKKIKGNIDIKKLNYSFNDRDLILKNINLNIKSGNKVMVIGKSGSGKSTLFKILMKYYEVEMGKVFIDGIDINNLSKMSIDNILYLGQNEILFTDTVYNNININNSDQKNFLSVCKMCYVDEIINKNNLGYNMLIEENGFNISGGEKQRIILARTLLKKFDILIIDEGTNQMDINLEEKILKNIFDIYKDKTIIFISHRKNNVNLFDSLLEISDGKIVGAFVNE